MTTYKEIFGKYVKNYSSDPSSDAEGQIWYNTTSGTFKTETLTLAAWASGGNMGTARRTLGGCGTQTAGLGYGGYSTDSASATEEYDGSTWTAGGSLPQGFEGPGSAGTQTAALQFGGYLQAGSPAAPPFYSNITNEYNGSSWTAGGNLNANRQSATGFGLQTAAIGAGGYGSGGYSSAVESYNGTAWTSVASLPAIRASFGSAGTQTAGLLFGGQAPPAPTNPRVATLSWDGSSWTSLSDMNLARVGGFGAGIQTAAITAGGQNGTNRINTTESWNGTSWTTLPATTVTLRASVGSAGTQTAGLMFGGNPGSPSTSNATEEFTGATLTTKTITTS
jgi:hypothetical protein